MFEAWTLRTESVKQKAEKLREVLRALDDPARVGYYQKYEKVVKDPDTYAVLNWFFLAGLHHFYLGKLSRGLMNLGLMLGGILLMTEAPGWGLLLILAVVAIELPALFRSQVIVENNNIERGFSILDELKVVKPPIS
jgi:hypothetical protein